MTSPRRRVRTFAGLSTGVAALVLATTALAAGGAADLLYERTLMTAADARCRLFDPSVGAALDSARAQARGAVLRGGASPETLHAIEQRARGRAAQTDCGSRDLQVAAGRVRSAFEGYARLIRMTWPGDVAGWRGDRTISREAPLWRLSQTAGFGHDRMVFGLAGKEGVGAVLASVSFADGATPYAARLVMRDPARAPQAYLDARRGGLKGRLPLSARIPPSSATQAFAAEQRSPASERLLPTGAKSGWLYRFPQRSADALAGLDPREAVAVDFLFSGPRGDQVRRAYVEVGDFAAGRAFLKVSPR
ncbi:hypothetical protein [Caulobacter mirabilis]|uniref:Uncharacterized protein n=1 Tax=Caulobacter mirabilis TaxID=69666 RepID=A0A2D2AVE4_9CAUL|nr:hypothetical protein [Caulobacter mirabilis]ATQ41968.1 hypothetical protein CSW64_05850 [Caulobacter mirabilis]